MNQFIGIVDRTSQALGRAVSWLSLVMAVVLFVVVILRYGFNIGWIWLQEVVTYLHAILFLLAAAYTLKDDEHVRIDIFYRTASENYRRRVNRLGSLLLLLPTCIFLGYFSFGYVLSSWIYLEGSRESGGLPLVFILKTFMLVFAVTLLLQCLAEIARNTITSDKK